MKTPLEKKYFMIIFVGIMLLILLEGGYDVLDRRRIEKLGVDGYGSNVHKYERDMNDCTIRIKDIKYGEEKIIDNDYYNHGDGETFVLKNVTTVDETLRICFVSTGYSGYYHGRIIHLDNYKGSQVETDAGAFRLEFVDKVKDEKNVYSYYYDVVSLNNADVNNVADITEMNFVINNIYETNYHRKDFEVHVSVILLLICLDLILWIISSTRTCRMKEWNTVYTTDDLIFISESDNVGIYKYKYNLFGATIRSMAVGMAVSIVLYITRSLWIFVVDQLTWGYIWVFTGGNEKVIIIANGIIATFLYLKHISEDIIREIQLDG